MTSKVDETLSKLTQDLIQPLDTTPPVTTAVFDRPQHRRVEQDCCRARYPQRHG